MMVGGDVAGNMLGNEVGCVIGCCVMTSMSIRKCLSKVLLRLDATRVSMQESWAQAMYIISKTYAHSRGQHGISFRVG